MLRFELIMEDSTAQELFSSWDSPCLSCLMHHLEIRYFQKHYYSLQDFTISVSKVDSVIHQLLRLDIAVTDAVVTN